MKNIGVLLAGGKGNRFGGEIPKQLIKVAGKTIIEHTIDVFQRSNMIDEIAIVSNPNYLSNIEEIVAKNRYSKVKKILNGGKERSDSSLAAINAYKYESKEVNLIFHDAVRPFIEDSIIDRVIKSLEEYNAVDVAIPATDTIIEVDSNNVISKVPNRDMLRRGQTPQAFKLSTIDRAYELAMQDPNFKATDDCGVVMKYLPEERIIVVDGSETNIKITYELDMFLADKLFQLNHIDFANTDISDEMKTVLKDKVVVIFGGSYGIGKDISTLLKDYGSKVYCFSRSLTNTNIKDPKAVREALELVDKRENTINYVINTAAILNKEPLMNIDDSMIDDILDVNYKGMVNVARESFTYLEKSNGHLLLYTSSSYTRGRQSYALYSSTKAAVVNFTQAISEEWRPFGIKVNCINPERTKTPMRIKNFGIEPEGSLLDSYEVAKVSILTILNDFSGQIVYVKR